VLNSEERLKGAFLFLNELKTRITFTEVCLPDYLLNISLYLDRAEQKKAKTYKSHFI